MARTAQDWRQEAIQAYEEAARLLSAGMSLAAAETFAQATAAAAIAATYDKRPAQRKQQR